MKQDIPGIINDALDRMSRDDQHGQIMVSRSLSYLTAARHGLTEDALLDVLAADDVIIDDIDQRSFHALPKRRCPVPIDAGISVSPFVSAIERVLEESGLTFEINCNSTNIEGE